MMAVNFKCAYRHPWIYAAHASQVMIICYQRGDRKEYFARMY